VYLRSRYVFRGHAYDKLPTSADISASRQLVYSRSSVVERESYIIRSKETARLLNLDLSPPTDRRLVYRGCDVLPRPSALRLRRTIQPGGFIRSRMTAELIGVEPTPSPSHTVRPGGFLRSRALANLLGVDPAPLLPTRVYRGVKY
jgi:hypothetical protein